jgi:PhnB protein
MTFLPYLFFKGDCREAFTRYQGIFGGKLDMMTVGDTPGSEAPVPPEQADLILHAAITVGDTMLMGSDDPTDSDGSHKGMSVSFGTKDPDEAKRVFEALSDGGEVQLPLGPTFFSPGFGMCTDRFGVPWMISVEAGATS